MNNTRNPRLPDFVDCPKCKGNKSCMKYTKTKNLSADFLCNNCGKHLKMSFGVAK